MFFPSTLRWPKLALVVAAIVLIGATATAQTVSQYLFLETTEAYTPLAGGTNSSATGDDGSQDNINIGFNFTYNGTVYSTFSINTNGWIRLGGAIPGSPWVNSLGSTSYPAAIAPFWDDNHRNAGTISYSTTGSPGSQVLTVDWNNVSIGGGGSTGGSASYQLRLHETTNAIDFVYGPTMTEAGGLSASIGLNGTPGTTYLSVTPGATSTVSSSTANNSISSTANIVGKRYTFTPPCNPLTASASLQLDCPNNQFFVIVDVTDIGGAPSVNVQSDFAGNPGGLAGVGVGTYQLGPFPDLANVNVSVIHNGSAICNKSLGAFSSDCAHLGQNALSFDGVNDMVNCGTNASINVTGSTFTMEAWVYPTSFRPNVWQGDVINREGTAIYTLRVGGTGQVNAAVKTASGTSDFQTGNNAVVLNTWQHVAATYDGAFVRIYVNGVEVANNARTGNMTSDATTPLAIGNSFAFPDRCFPGKIDEVRIWNVVRTPSELAGGMGTLMCGNETGLLAYYQFDQGTAGANNAGVTTLTDLTANANHGTLTNFALTGGTSNWVQGRTGLGACVPVTCPTPTSTAATSVNAHDALANWTNNGGGGTWIVEYGLAATFTTPGTGSTPGTGGTVITNAVAPQLMGPLTSNTQYRYFVRQDCGGGNFSFNSSPITFTTPINCLPPTALTASGVTLTSANLSWTAPAANPGCAYQWEVRSSGAAGSGATGLAASGPLGAGVVSTSTGAVLTPNTNYSFYVRADCGGGDFSVWAGPTTFRTGYCVPAPTSVSGSGITNVTIANVNNTTGTETGNYGDYSSMVATVPVNTSVPIQVRFATTVAYNMKIWVDWNNDLTFSDPSEVVFTGTTAGNPFTFNATIPTGATAGQFRMRIGGRSTTTAVTSCYTGTSGSFEDYTLNVLPCTPPTVTATMVPDCANSRFFVNVNVSSLGDAASVGVHSDFAGDPGGQASAGTGNVQLGPFPDLASANVTVTHSGNSLCNLSLGNFTLNCATLGLNALSFDGVNDRVDIGTAPAVSITGANITLEAWIYPTAWRTSSFEGTIINKEGPNLGYMLRAGANGTLSFALGNGSTIPEVLSSTGALTLNTWQHVAGTYDGANMRIYVNGNPVGTQAQTISLANSTNPLRIGDWSATGGRAFPGRIDEVRIWNLTRSQAEIQSGMNVLMCGNEPGLRAYYRFDQGIANYNNTSVTTLSDQSIYANHGTLAGFTLNGTVSNWVQGKTDLGACTPVACPAPLATAATNVAAFSAQANWTTTGGSGTWILEYGPAATFTTPGTDANPGPNGTVILNAVAPQLIAGLNEETTYRYFIRLDCGLGSYSPNSAPITFTTPPSCLEPLGMAVSDQTTTSATLSWTAPAQAPANGYQWEVRTSGAAGSGATGLALSGSTLPGVVSVATGATLTPNTNYVLYVRSDCGAGDFSHWTAGVPFRTGYCVPAPSSVSISGITNVSFANVNNTTGPEPGNYGDYSALVGNVGQNATVPVNITFQTGAAYATKIWVDWNNDLDFTDAGEELYTGTSSATNPTTLAASIAIGSNPLGQHRMRIGSVAVAPATPCYTGTLGSYEDYTLNVLPCTPPAATATVVSDCANSRFFISVNVANLGDAASVGVHSDFAGDPGGQASVGTGTVQIGPFPDLANVAVTVTHAGNSLCDLALGSFTMNCATINYNALSFDGTNDRVDCGNNPSLNITGTKVTVEAWIYPTAWRTESWRGNIINKEGAATQGYMIRCGANGTLSFNIGDGTNWREVFSPVGALTLNTWQHVAGTYDGTTMRAYINGVEVGSLTASFSIASSPNPVIIGDWAVSSTGERCFPGKIDEVRVWNKTLSASTLQAHMNTAYCGNETGLAAYYKFDQGVRNADNAGVTTLTDLTANANNGTLSGFALNGTTSNWVEGQTNMGACVPVLCFGPSSVTTANVGPEAADVSWVCSGCTGSIVLEYGLSGFVPGTGSSAGAGGTVVLNATSPTHIAGLSPTTAYDVYVRQDCGVDGFSENNNVSFTTALGCGGDFYDTGGPSNSYANNENYTQVICPNTPGDLVTVTFSEFSTEASWDPLYVYDGNSTSATKIASTNGVPGANNVYGTGGWWGSAAPNNIAPNVVRANNPTGCLTFAFTSDGSGTPSGWAASITCFRPNNTCANAMAVTCGNLYSGFTTGVPHSLPAGACAYNGAPSTGGQNYWVYTATADEEVTISTCGASDFDLRLSVFTGTGCGDLACYAMADNSPGCANGSAQLSFPVTNGATYYIVVHGAGAAEGTYQMAVTCAPLCTPASTNDQCASATALTPALAGSGSFSTEDNTCAFGDAPTSCSGADPVQGVWYSFNSGVYNHLLLTLADNGENPVYSATTLNYALYTGACSGLGATGEAACVMDAAGTHVLNVVPNTDYRLLVYNDGGIGEEGTFGLKLEHPTANDAVLAAITYPAPGLFCSTSIAPVVTLYNNGDAVLGSVQFVYDIDGGTPLTYSWTGSLPFQASTSVTLPAIVASPGNHTLNVRTQLPNGAPDEMTANDAQSVVLNISGESVVVSIRTDAYGEQTSWQIYDGFFFVVAEGGPYTGQNNTIINTTACLPTTFGNCYSFFLFDSFGDGMCCANGNGFWEIRSLSGSILLRDRFMSAPDGFQSPASAPQAPGYINGHEFCLPEGPASIMPDECGIFTNTLQSKVYCKPIPGAPLYQFEFSDPDAGFRRFIAVPRNWVKFNEMVTVPLVPGVVYFARARADQGANGLADDHFGPGCEMAIDPNTGCTSLIDDIGLPTHSCGVNKRFGASDKIWARPITGASQYRFRFTNAGEGFVRIIEKPSYVCLLSWVALPLQVGATYDVQVEVLVSGVWSGFCGPTCQLTIIGPGSRPERSLQAQPDASLLLWPNPNTGDRITLRSSGLDPQRTSVPIEVMDLFGKQVLITASPIAQGELNTILRFDQQLAAGTYLVRVTDGEHTFLERFVVQR
ncbi:MAG: fibronectin type III domain-containing protein [Bacteroidetes bacterium]|nr:fibronectin type III domain-containing protein [Bacteroidota bacterium]